MQDFIVYQYFFFVYVHSIIPRGVSNARLYKTSLHAGNDYSGIETFFPFISVFLSIHIL